MLRLAATLHLLGLNLTDKVRTSIATRDSERGAVTVEQVLWAVAVVAIVGLVVTAIRAYVIAEANKLNG